MTYFHFRKTSLNMLAVHTRMFASRSMKDGQDVCNNSSNIEKLIKNKTRNKLDLSSLEYLVT